MSYITGVGLTSYGKHEGFSSLDLMSKAAELAIADAGLQFSLPLQGGGLGWGSATSDGGRGGKIPTRFVLKHKSTSPFQGEVRP
jgi:hypothetical protein